MYQFRSCSFFFKHHIESNMYDILSKVYVTTRIITYVTRVFMKATQNWSEEFVTFQTSVQENLLELIS